MNQFESSYLGKLEYSHADNMQKYLYGVVKEKNLNAIMGLEHPKVMTLGYRLDPVNLEFRENHEIPVVKSSRGGLVTIHSEGQLVIYPILNLKKLGWGAKRYVHQVLSTTQELLNELGVPCWIDEEAIGLYTEKGKIAFCGIQIKNGISMHGLSLNVRNDLSLFSQIDSCGVKLASLDRLQNYNVNLTLEELFKKWITHFKAKINFSI